MKNYFAENLKKIRKEHHLSQEQLAEELGVSRQSVSKWESESAYPEMEKLIQICQKFDINIDDLLNNDITEVKKEEGSKKTVNIYIDQFLSFMTETIDLFSAMTFKSKIKCILELGCISIILLIVFLTLGYLCRNIVRSMLFILPDTIYMFVMNVLTSLYTLVALLAGAGILFLIFKNRYLDYYVCKDDSVGTTEEDKQIGEVQKEKKAFKPKKERQIIIRDPSHGRYRFINGLVKCFVVGMKCFAGILLALFGFAFIALCACLVISFLISKTGLFFIGILIVLIASVFFVGGICLWILNFIMNRKIEKKYMIYGCLSSLVCIGVGCGLIFTGSLNFNIVNSCNHSKTQTFILEDTTKDISLPGRIEYIEEDRDDIKIEYTAPDYMTVRLEDVSYYYFSEEYNVFDMMRDFIRHLNHYELLGFESEIKFYASHDVILKHQTGQYMYEEYMYEE